MRSKFHVICANAREGIAVPEVPLVAIQNAAADRPAPAESKRRKRILYALLVGASVTGAGAVAQLWNGTDVTFGPSGALQMSTVEEFRLKKDPSSQDLRAVVSRATFPVQLPVGLPPGTTLAEVAYGPSFILLDYNLPGAWRRSNHLLRIALVDPRAFSTTTGAHAFIMRMGGLAATGSVRWYVGREVVIVMRSKATPVEIKRIKAAMTEAARRQH
jgi:hypothetical protein